LSVFRILKANNLFIQLKNAGNGRKIGRKGAMLDLFSGYLNPQGTALNPAPAARVARQRPRGFIPFEVFVRS